MKKIILSLIGISFLFLSCNRELIEFQEDDSFSFSTRSAQVTATCEPDLEALKESLPETVTVTTKDPECSDTGGAFLAVDIAEGDLASLDNDAYCIDLDGSIDLSTYTFDVYSSYDEELSGLEKSPGIPLFENPDDFDRINWLLNQDIIGTESLNGGTYTFGHVQWAIWQIIEGAGNNCTDDCDYLSCNPINQWDNDKAYNESLGLELVERAEAGEGFVPQCGQQIAVVLASTEQQSLIITIDVPEKEEECKDCEGNVTELTLQYNGTKEAYIEVKTKDEGVNDSKIVFQGNVAPGETFTIYGNDENGTFGKEIKVYVDGDYVKIKTDCSEDIGPGLILEDIEVISGKSSNGAYLCPKVCDECEGKVNNLTLQYNGAEKANIRVETKKDGENGEKVVFEGMVEAGAEFSFVGNDKKGTLGTEITIYVNDLVNTKIHTSCSQPIGPGLISGDFEVISGSSREGGDLCPVDTPPGGGDDCNECDGKITRLDLQYNGSGTNIEILSKKDDIVIYSGNLNNDPEFTINGFDKKGTLGTEIIIKIDGVTAQKIHTSCSVDIGAGSVFGDFTVLGGASRNGGELCPVDVPPTSTDCECDGGIVSVTFTYSGSLADLSSDDDDASFTDNDNGTVTLATFDGDKLSNPEIFFDGDNVGEIHASCSDNILGLSYGPLTVVEYLDKEGGVISIATCPVDPVECDCDGKIVKMSVVYAGPNGATVTLGDEDDGSNTLQTFTNVQSGAILEGTIGDVGNWWYWSVNGNLQASIHTSCSDDILGNVDASKSIFGNMGNYPDPADDDGNKNDGTFLVTSHTDEKGNTCSLSF